MKKDPDLLRPFDMEKAKAGEAICWSNLSDSFSFIGETAQGSIAGMTPKGVIATPFPQSLRMKPLFWKDSKPVYKGDKLWHKIAKKFIEVDCLQDEIGAEAQGFFVDTDGINVMAELCFWDEPKPEPLFQHEGKDVFPGDRLWNHLYKDYVTVARMQDPLMIGGAYYFMATDGSHCCTAFCSWDKPGDVLGTHYGLPVRVNSTLWHNHDNCWVEIVGVLPNKDFLDDTGKGRSPCHLQWDKPAPPKTTQVRYANVYNGNNQPMLGPIHFTKELAEKSASCDARGIARIEWEE